MIELETVLIPTLSDCLVYWKRYVDDTIAYVDLQHLERIVNTLNSFDRNIQFTYEMEKDCKISFLDVAILKDTNKSLSTTVYRKRTDTNIYIHWTAHAPLIWKKSTITMMVKRALNICSNNGLLDSELSHIKNVFCDLNGYPVKFVQNMINSIRKNHVNLPKTTVTEDTTEEKSNAPIQICLPYLGRKGENIITKMKKKIKEKLTDQISTRVIYTTTKLNSKFKTKDQTKFEHKNNLVYQCECPDCHKKYVGETSRRLIERLIDHNKRDNRSHVLNLSKEEQHTHIWKENIEIIGNNYKNKIKRKISESYFIRDIKPELNKQDTSFPLKLYK